MKISQKIRIVRPEAWASQYRSVNNKVKWNCEMENLAKF